MDDMIFSFKVETPPAWIPIGRTAENDWRTIEIDCSYWFNMDASGNVVLMYRPNCGMAPYPLLIERDGDNIVWHPKSGELVEGVGQMQAFFYVGESKIGSSEMVSCEVDGSLLGGDTGTDPGAVAPPWAIDIIEQIAVLSGHYPKIENGVLYIWDSDSNEWVQFQGGGGVNPNAVLYTEQTLTESQKAQARGNIGAGTYTKPSGGIPDSDIASAATWNAKGTYSKPSGGIPKTDLASDVQTSLEKADTALQTAPVSSVNNKTGVVSLNASDVGATPEPLEIPVTESDGTYSTTVTAEQIRAAKENSVFVFNGEMRIKALLWLPWGEGVALLIGMQMLNGAITAVVATVTTNNVAITVEQTLIPTAVSELTNDSGYQTAQDVQTAISGVRQLPAVTASDNGKFLRVVNGAWAAETVSTWQGGSY